MRIICNQSMPDLLCISESWLSSGHEDIEFQINGYDLYRKDKEFSNGSGVCLFIKKSDSFAVNVIENNTNLDMIFFEVSQKNTKSFTVIVVYSPPDGSIEYLNELLHNLENNSKTETIIVGDINKDYLNKSNAKHFENYFDLGFEQLIDENTRIIKESESCIDLVITNNLNEIVLFLL
jgi:exonuclease III